MSIRSSAFRLPAAVLAGALAVGLGALAQPGAHADKNKTFNEAFEYGYVKMNVVARGDRTVLYTMTNELNAKMTCRIWLTRDGQNTEVAVAELGAYPSVPATGISSQSFASGTYQANGYCYGVKSGDRGPLGIGVEDTNTATVNKTPKTVVIGTEEKKAPPPDKKINPNLRVNPDLDKSRQMKNKEQQGPPAPNPPAPTQPSANPPAPSQAAPNPPAPNPAPPSPPAPKPGAEQK